jgi:hypothetical protein
VGKHHACAHVPVGFSLGALETQCRDLIDQVLGPAIDASIAQEGWPPPPATRRKRVRAFRMTGGGSECALAAPPTAHVASGRSNMRGKKSDDCRIDVGVGVGGCGVGVGGCGDGTALSDVQVGPVAPSHTPTSGVAAVHVTKATSVCKQCNGIFDPLWVHVGLCAVCEQAHRLSGAGLKSCLYGCKFGADAFCTHAGRCFACDTPHACEVDCRLSRGDGEVVAAKVLALRPELLLVDFDRTLATTKSGASPMPKGAG